MKIWSFGLALFSAFVCVETAVLARDVVAPGDSYESVVQSLGEPRGTIHIGVDTILTFDRGEVDLREGKVTSVDLISAAQFAANEQRRAQQSERDRQQREIRAAEGQKLYSDVISDSAFAAKPARDQLLFWQDFRRRYPEVPADSAYLVAATKYTAEQEEENTRARAIEKSAELERRVALAEARASSAEAAAKAALSLVVTPPESADAVASGPGFINYPALIVLDSSYSRMRKRDHAERPRQPEYIRPNAIIGGKPAYISPGHLTPWGVVIPSPSQKM